MLHIQKIVRRGATFAELIKFVEECKENEIPLNTPVKISQLPTETSTNVVDMQTNEDSIIFYDWI